MKIQRRNTAALAAIALSLLLSVTGCQEDIFPIIPSDGSQGMSITRATNLPSALEQTAEGYWMAHKCVPLVGKGRIIDHFSDGLVKVAGQTGGPFEQLLDTNLDNYANFGGGLIGAEVLANQLVSVRDLDRTYAGGQTAGFVCQLSDTKLLTLEVLKNFWVKTYLDGKLQETQEGSTEGSLLGLDLISFGTGDAPRISISAKFEKPFDEIQLGMTGVDANVLNAFNIYYAFVGEHEEKPVYIGNPHFAGKDPEIHKGVEWTNGAFLNSNLKKLLDTDLENGFTTDLFSELLGTVYITVNINKTIPAGSEIGFYITSGSLLEIGLFKGVKLTTFDENNKEQEEALTMSVASVGAASGGKRKISMVTTRPCSQVKINFTGVNVNLGATTIHYAYVKDPAAADPSSRFSLSDVTITGNSYHLSAPKYGTTTWSILSFPLGAMPKIEGNKISGMTVDGDYIVSGTYTDSERNSITQQITITRSTQSMSDGCNQVIGTEYGAEPYMPQNGGSLITLENIKDVNNLTDDDTYNYATYTNFISIAANTPIIGIAMKSKAVEPVSSGKVRTGFVMQTSGGLLGADLLKFFCIKLYKDGVKVLDQPVDNSDVANVGLIGSKGNKIRIGVTTRHSFDKIELWTAGVLNLNLQQYHLYHAYWEDADANCISVDPSEACIELLTPASHGAEINYTETMMGGLAEIGGSFNNLGNLLDSDLETYATISQGAQALGTTSVAVKFDEITDETKSTRVGFILKRPAGLIDLNVLQGTVLKIYHKGVKVGKTGDGDLLGLDLIGYAGRIYVETTAVTTAFDEVRISFPTTVDVLGTMQLSGAFIRRDSDGDGIPDCAEDENNEVENPSITDARAESEHLCKPEQVVINVTGGTEETTYNLRFYDNATGSHIELESVLENGKFVIPTGNISVGDWYISIYNSDKIQYNGVHVAIHAQETTWKNDATTTNWQSWANWTNGVPWGCTRVVIPSDCTNYPVLKEQDDNRCAEIHFCAGAEVVHTYYLTYEQAWVELSLGGGRYYMLSAPLKDMVTGDMFIPALYGGDHSKADRFVPQHSSNCRESRFTPVVYQRLWSSDAPGRTIDGPVTVTPDVTNWTPPFNALAQSYDAGMGFSLKAGDNSTSFYTFRFPKTHDVYAYVNSNGASTGHTEAIPRSGKGGRFIYEDENDAPGDASSYRITVKNGKAGKTFIAGNPFMAHIDVSRFLQANPTVKDLKIHDGNSIRTLMLLDGKLARTDGSAAYLSPMQAFFVSVESDANELTLNYGKQMLVQKPGTGLAKRPSASRAATRSAGRSVSNGWIRLFASCSEVSSECLVRLHPGTSDGYRAGEDSRLLLDNEVPTTLAVFTEADGAALDIQQVSTRREIPIGFYLKEPTEVTVTLVPSVGTRSEWALVDKQTGQRWSLKEGAVQVELGEISSHTGRFFLVTE